MTENRHSILCVDDEENVLNALKRLLRKENYQVLTARDGAEGLNILETHKVHLVICDQRMPGMSGIDFLTIVKKRFPGIIRMVLTGYTDVDTVTESVNKGQIYKFIAKPWDDQHLKLEIRRGLEQFDLIRDNRRLYEKIIRQNNKLLEMNTRLEAMVRERTRELELQNHALELSYAILEDIPIPVVGISREGMIAFINHSAQVLHPATGSIVVGKKMADFFPEAVQKAVNTILSGHICESIRDYRIRGQVFEIIPTPLSGRFYGQGVVLVFKEKAEAKSTSTTNPSNIQ